MRKDTTTTKLTKIEKERNKKISKKRYIAAPCGIRSNNIKVVYSNYPNKQCKVKDIDVSIPRGKKQYFGLSHMYDGFRLDSVLEGNPPRKVEPPARRGHIEHGSPLLSKTSAVPR